MRDASHLARLDALAKVQAAVLAGARLELAARNAEVDAAQSKERQASAERDESLVMWRELLSAPRPDFALARLAGGWLLECEKSLGATQLDTEIVERRRRSAAASLAEAHGGDNAIKALGQSLRKALAKKREEDQAAQLADMLLVRRRG